MYSLSISLEENGLPFYQQIYRFVREEIRQGRMAPATRLPSTRLLASSLSVSRSTTQAAYDQLLAEGYLVARPCSGYYVAEMETLRELPVTQGMAATREDPSRGLQRGDGKKGAERIDFSPRGIDEAQMPVGIWRKLTRRILSEREGQLFNAGASQGEEEFRQAICSYLHSARGVVCQPEQIVVGAGSEYLLLLLSQLLQNRRVAMEEYTYKQAFRVLRCSGMTVQPAVADSSGLRADALEEAGAGLAYVMPSHQFPGGGIMPIKRRLELLAWAAAGEERYLLEDDYDSEFRYRGRPIPALQGADTLGRVIYLGTFSRSVAPAIRISYLVLPPSLLERYREGCDFYSSTVSKIDQYVLTAFLNEGYFERHLNRMRKVYREKHDAVLKGLEPIREDFVITGENAGIHLLLTSRGGKTEEWLKERARAAGVLLQGLSAYRIGEATADSSTVLLGYAGNSLDEIREGTRLLCRAWLQEEV